MKHAIDCTFDTIASPVEQVWIITVDHAAIPDAIILLTALRLGKISQIKLQTALLSPDHLELEDTAIPINATWLDAVCAMLVNTYLNGWSPAAHLDQDFPTPSGEIRVCISVEPPKSCSI